MAAAYRDLDPATFDPDGDLLDHVDDLEMTSLVGMVDPPREESKAAVADAQEAHIRVRMVTGDDVVTGAAIAKQLGIPGEAMLGADFAALTEQERLDRIEDIGVVGRVAPEHKVLLADTLKQKGDVVAMTGDGVNDAPAIKAADIGIAMGSGTEVAKNAGRMILSDDNFATIVYAVEQGRKLYDNLTKYIRFVLLLLVAFILTFLGAALLNIAAGQPFTPGQVLWIHFLVERALRDRAGLRPGDAGPDGPAARARAGQSVLTSGMLVTCGLVGLFMAVANLLLIELGIAPLPQHQDRVVDGPDRVRADAGRGRLRMPEREGVGVRLGHVQQLEAEPDRARRDPRGGSHHAMGLPPAPARHNRAHRSAVGGCAARRHRPAAGVGAREVDRAPSRGAEGGFEGGGSGVRGLARIAAGR